MDKNKISANIIKQKNMSEKVKDLHKKYGFINFPFGTYTKNGKEYIKGFSGSKSIDITKKLADEIIKYQNEKYSNILKKDNKTKNKKKTAIEEMDEELQVVEAMNIEKNRIDYANRHNIVQPTPKSKYTKKVIKSYLDLDRTSSSNWKNKQYKTFYTKEDIGLVESTIELIRRMIQNRYNSVISKVMNKGQQLITTSVKVIFKGYDENDDNKFYSFQLTDDDITPNKIKDKLIERSTANYNTLTYVIHLHSIKVGYATNSTKGGCSTQNKNHTIQISKRTKMILKNVKSKIIIAVSLVF